MRKTTASRWLAGRPGVHVRCWFDPMSLTPRQSARATRELLDMLV